MIKPRTNFFKAIYAFMDATIIFISYYLSEWLYLGVIKPSDNILLHGDMRGYVLAAVTVYSVLLVLAFSASGIYKSFRYRSVMNVWLRSILLHGLFIGAVAVGLYILRVVDVSRGMLLLFFLVAAVLLLIKHSISIALLRIIRRKGFNQKHVVLYGSGALAEQYVSTLNERQRYGITVDGYISEKRNDALGTYLGGFDALEKQIAGSSIDEVVIAADDDESADVCEVIECCEKCGTRVCVIPFFNNMISANPSINTIGELKCLELRTSPLDSLMNSLIKRLFDILFSLFMIVLTSPVMLVVALLVKLSSPGPVLFRQARVGKDKKEFTMLKFRSMRVNAESATAWSKDKDPRRTAIGSFIRKTSIDELPQFFNVLRGDMSVIGPRPEIPHYVEQFRETIPRYMVKHMVRPGITGWAQVNGYRGDTSIEERIKHDLWYIENWSVKLDIKILFRTVFGGMVNNEK